MQKEKSKDMNLKFSKEIQIKETEEFGAFASEIDSLIDFFENFSGLMFFNGRIISFISDKNIYALNTNLIDSSVQTLRSIKLCCSIGSFSDANTLIRKLRDDLIQYVYILNIVKLRQPFVEDDLKNIKFDNPENFANSLLDIKLSDNLTDDEKAISAWLNNTVSDLTGHLKRKLEFKNYMKILKQNRHIIQILKKYKLEKYWESLRSRLNDYVHNNGTKFSTYNLIKANDKNLKIHLNNINIRTSYISSFFITLLLMIDSSLISSTDYIDHIECDLDPPDNSQYYIASFIQNFIDTKVSKLHPELKQFLKDNDNYGMKIE